jgi:hypothetical protein
MKFQLKKSSTLEGVPQMRPYIATTPSNDALTLQVMHQIQIHIYVCCLTVDSFKAIAGFVSITEF